MSVKLAQATLKDGKVIQYIDDMIGEGAMKQVYFTADRSSVVCFFKDAQDRDRLRRLEAVLGKYNPTTDPKTGDYWKKLYCWPTAIVTSPRLGIVAPAYPKNYFFATGPFKGKEKEGLWFLGKKVRKLLPADELGNWFNYFKMCLLMARAVRRLHSAGLAHSDLSAKNVLVDPCAGVSIIIDIDSLVVPGIYPPDVLGSPGYIAPEVIATQHLDLKDPKRQHPCIRTDAHALAVLIYEYLLLRHPLRGMKIHSSVSAEEDERLAMGANALFVEHPSDGSNRPKDLKIPYTVLGPQLTDLTQRAFVKGLHSRYDRPTAMEWEAGLVRTWDMLYPCPNKACVQKWFVLDPNKPRCPWCQQRLAGPIPLLKLWTERGGKWRLDWQMIVRDGVFVFNWHVLHGLFPDENADRTPLGYCTFHQGKWYIVNQAMKSLTSPAGNPVAPGQFVELKDGVRIRLSQEPNGRTAEVQMLRT